MEEINIDGPVSDGVPLPFQVVVQPTLIFFKPIAAPTASASIDAFLTAAEAAAYLDAREVELNLYSRPQFL